MYMAEFFSFSRTSTSVTTIASGYVIVDGTKETQKPKVKTKNNLGGSFSYFDENGYAKEVYITRILYNNPATIVFWSDGTKTITKAIGGDAYSKEVGLMVCVMKKTLGGDALATLIKNWVVEEKEVTLKNVRKKVNK